MKVMKFSTLALIALMTTSIMMVYAVPPIPHQFFGYVTMGSSMAPDGTIIEARINGVTYEITTTISGRYGWDPTFRVPGDDPDTGTVEGGVNGDIIEFYVDGAWAANHTFMMGEVTELSLEPTIPFEIFLFEGWNLIGLPMIPEDPSIENVLSDIIYYVKSVWAFDGETGTWSSYSLGAPSDLTQILAGKGYWINMITDVLWTIDIPGYYGTEPTDGVNYTWSGEYSRNTAPFYISSDIIKISWSIEPDNEIYYCSFSMSLYDVDDGWYVDSWQWYDLEEFSEGDTYVYVSPGYYYISFDAYYCSYVVELETFSP